MKEMRIIYLLIMEDECHTNRKPTDRQTDRQGRDMEKMTIRHADKQKDNPMNKQTNREGTWRKITCSHTNNNETDRKVMEKKTN